MHTLSIVPLSLALRKRHESVQQSGRLTGSDMKRPAMNCMEWRFERTCLLVLHQQGDVDPSALGERSTFTTPDQQRNGFPVAGAGLVPSVDVDMFLPFRDPLPATASIADAANALEAFTVETFEETKLRSFQSIGLCGRHLLETGLRLGWATALPFVEWFHTAASLADPDLLKPWKKGRGGAAVEHLIKLFALHRPPASKMLLLGGCLRMKSSSNHVAGTGRQTTLDLQGSTAIAEPRRDGVLLAVNGRNASLAAAVPRWFASEGDSLKSMQALAVAVARTLKEQRVKAVVRLRKFAKAHTNTTHGASADAASAFHGAKSAFVDAQRAEADFQLLWSCLRAVALLVGPDFADVKHAFPMGDRSWRCLFLDIMLQQLSHDQILQAIQTIVDEHSKFTRSRPTTKRVVSAPRSHTSAASESSLWSGNLIPSTCVADAFESQAQAYLVEKCLQHSEEAAARISTAAAEKLASFKSTAGRASGAASEAPLLIEKVLAVELHPWSGPVGLRRLAMPLWVREVSELRRVLDAVARRQFARTRKVEDVAVYYAALGRKHALAQLYVRILYFCHRLGLYAMCACFSVDAFFSCAWILAANVASRYRTIENDAVRAEFFASDFSSEVMRKKAVKNSAFLHARRRFSLAAAIYLIMEPPNIYKALVCIGKGLNDPILAMTVGRVAEAQVLQTSGMASRFEPTGFGQVSASPRPHLGPETRRFVMSYMVSYFEKHDQPLLRGVALWWANSLPVQLKVGGRDDVGFAGPREYFVTVCRPKLSQTSDKTSESLKAAESEASARSRGQHSPLIPSAITSEGIGPTQYLCAEADAVIEQELLSVSVEEEDDSACKSPLQRAQGSNVRGFEASRFSTNHQFRVLMSLSGALEVRSEIVRNQTAAALAARLSPVDIVDTTTQAQSPAAVGGTMFASFGAKPSVKPKPKPTPAPSPASAASDMFASFGAKPKPKPTPAPSPAPAASDMFASFGAKPKPKPAPAPSPAPASDMFASFGAKPKPKPSPAPSPAPAAADMFASFGAKPKPKPAPAPSPAPAASDMFASFGAKPKPKPSPAPSPAPAAADMFASFGAKPKPKPSPAPSPAPAAADMFASFGAKPKPKPAPAPSPAPAASDMFASFGAKPKPKPAHVPSAAPVTSGMFPSSSANTTADRPAALSLPSAPEIVLPPPPQHIFKIQYQANCPFDNRTPQFVAEHVSTRGSAAEVSSILASYLHETAASLYHSDVVPHAAANEVRRVNGNVSSVVLRKFQEIIDPAQLNFFSPGDSADGTFDFGDSDETVTEKTSTVAAKIACRLSAHIVWHRESDAQASASTSSAPSARFLPNHRLLLAASAHVGESSPLEHSKKNPNTSENALLPLIPETPRPPSQHLRSLIRQHLSTVATFIQRQLLERGALIHQVEPDTRGSPGSLFRRMLLERNMLNRSAASQDNATVLCANVVALVHSRQQVVAIAEQYVASGREGRDMPSVAPESPFSRAMFCLEQELLLTIALTLGYTEGLISVVHEFCLAFSTSGPSSESAGDLSAPSQVLTSDSDAEVQSHGSSEQATGANRSGSGRDSDGSIDIWEAIYKKLRGNGVAAVQFCAKATLDASIQALKTNVEEVSDVSQVVDSEDGYDSDERGAQVQNPQGAEGTASRVAPKSPRKSNESTASEQELSVLRLRRLSLMKRTQSVAKWSGKWSKQIETQLVLTFLQYFGLFTFSQALNRICAGQANSSSRSNDCAFDDSLSSTSSIELVSVEDECAHAMTFAHALATQHVAFCLVDLRKQIGIALARLEAGQHEAQKQYAFSSGVGEIFQRLRTTYVRQVAMMYVIKTMLVLIDVVPLGCDSCVLIQLAGAHHVGRATYNSNNPPKSDTLSMLEVAVNALRLSILGL